MKKTTRPRFTPRSARRTIELIRPAAERMCRICSRMQAQRPEGIEPDTRVAPAYFRALLELHATLGEILRSGARIRDVKRGVLEFPARREGRDVMLCWHVGEPSLAYWHDGGAGSAGAAARRPLDDDGPWDDT